MAHPDPPLESSLIGNLLWISLSNNFMCKTRSNCKCVKEVLTLTQDVSFFPVCVWQSFAFQKRSGYRSGESDVVRIKRWCGGFHFGSNLMVALVKQRWAWTWSGLDFLQDTCDFLDQDWIWIFIFFNWIRTRSGYLFDLYTEIFLRVIQDVTNDGGGSVSFAMFFILSVCVHSLQSMVIRVTLSLIFFGQVEVVSCSYIAGMLLCLLCWMAYVCVVYSGDSRIKKVGGHCGTKEKAGGQHKCLSCKVIFHWFEDYVAMINPIKPNIGLWISLNMN